MLKSKQEDKMEKLNLKSKKVKTHNIRKILPFYAKSKGLIAFLVVLFLFGGVVGIMQPIFSANALASIAERKFNDAIKFAILMCSLGICRVLFNGLIEAVYLRINVKTKMQITKLVINSINDTKMSKLDSTKLGYLSERLSSDVNSASDAYLDMMNLIFDILTNVVFLGYIAFLNVYLFLILLAYVVLLYVVCTIRSRIVIRGRKIVKSAFDEARSSYYEQVSGIKDVKLLNLKENVTNFSNKKYENALKTEVKINDKRNMMRRIQGAFSISFELLFVLLGIIFVNKGLILLTGFLVIYTYYGRVEGLVNFISQFKEFSAEGEIAATRIFEVVEDYEKESFGSETIENFSGKIKFDDVSFSYNGETNVLKNVNLEFDCGKMTAIVGKSGSGKTTILNLISKLYDVGSGKILFDDKNIVDLTENSIRDNVCEISQSPYIFNSSIRQNLLFAKPDATDDELIEVLKQAQIYDDVEKMEKGLDTEIGENGIKISGGQKQRIAIARLLLKNPKVIVFDEATSALDNSSQKKIVDLLEKFKNKKTIIIVAHRLSTIIDADKIYMLDSGEVIASGTHNFLMKNCKSYKDLYKLEEDKNNDIDD